MVKDVVEGVIGAIIGGIIGAGIGYWEYASAQAAVEVRPDLANVGGWEAFLADHFTDWLYYNHTEVGFAITILLCAAVLGAFGYFERWL